MERNSSVILPKPWSIHFSKSRNLTYYFNSLTGESLWNPPQGTIIGGELIPSSETTRHEEEQPLKTKQSSDSKKASISVGAVVTQQFPEDSFGRSWVTNSVSAPCSRTETIQFATEVPLSRSAADTRLTDTGLETVSSSITRKRKLEKHSPHKLSRPKLCDKIEDSGSSVLPVSHDANLQKECNRTPAASRLEKLQSLLLQLQHKKKPCFSNSGTVSFLNSTNTTPANTTSPVNRKRCSVTGSSPEKRQRLSSSVADASNAAETCADVHPSCAVTSTTVSSSTGHNVDSDCDEQYGPESPKPGEKLPYLDNTSESEDDVITSASEIIQKNVLELHESEKDDSSSSSSKVVSSSFPSAAWSNSHKKEHIRKGTWSPTTVPATDNVPQPVQGVTGTCHTVTSKTEVPLKVLKVSCDELCTEKSTSNSNESIKTRLSSGSSNKGNSECNLLCKTEEKPLLTLKLFSEVPSISCASNARVSVQNRLCIPASGEGSSQSNETSKIERKPLLCSSKRFSDELGTVNTTKTARESVQRRLEISPSDRGNSESNLLCKAEEKSLATPDKKLFLDEVPSVSCTSNARVSVQSSPSVEASGEGTNQINVTTERRSVCSGKRLSAELGTVNIACNNRESVQRRLEKYTSDRADTTAYAEDENMEVDIPVVPEAAVDSNRNCAFDDTASVSSEIPDIDVKCTDDFKKWLDECNPSSPVLPSDFFLCKEQTDDESDEVMEWNDIEDDLSQVVSHMPPKCADADEWFIVVDTNILLHSLHIVEELRDTPFSKLSLPVLVIPWQVLQELDHLKSQHNQYKSNYEALCGKARRAVQFLNNNLKKRHPRVRGQTARESEFEHYKRQGADDGILQCCLQLKEKGNLAVILTDDKNLANKAIVSGIPSFDHDEILVKLHEMGLQLQPSASQIQTKETAAASSSTVIQSRSSDQTDFEKTKVDLVFCHMKLLLKDILTEVLTSGMKKMYGSMWQSRTVKQPPWTLSDVVHCILKHWNVMKEYEFRQNKWPSRDDKFMSCAKDMMKHLIVLQTFLKNSSHNCFNYSSSDMKDILNCCIDVCIGMTAVSFREKLIETINKLEGLREVCKEKSRETVMSMLSNILLPRCDSMAPDSAAETKNLNLKYVGEKFSDTWQVLASICGSVCDVMNIQHNLNYTFQYEFKNVTLMYDKISQIWPHLKVLNKCFQQFEFMPVNDLSEDDQLIKDIYFSIKNIRPKSDKDLDDILTPHLVYTYMVHPKKRQTVMKIKEDLRKIEEYLMQAIMCISQK